jgi:predicted Zn-ribbon and HTH transcriptional regulator
MFEVAEIINKCEDCGHEEITRWSRLVRCVKCKGINIKHQIILE